MARWHGRKSISPPPSSPFDLALRFLAQRPRSELEVRRRLQRAGVEAGAIDDVLARLRQHGIVDDAEFARYWVGQRQTFKPRGARLLRAELRQHGIDSTAAAEQVMATVGESAAEDAYRAAAKRARLLAAADERLFKTRLGQFLNRRGFDWDTVAKVTERLWAESLAAQ